MQCLQNYLTLEGWKKDLEETDFKKYLKEWSDYPIKIFESKELFGLNGVVLGVATCLEGLILGSIGYCVTQEPGMVALGPLITIPGRLMLLPILYGIKRIHKGIVPDKL